MADAEAAEDSKTDGLVSAGTRRWSPTGVSTLDGLMQIVESDDYRDTVGTPWKDGHEFLYQGVGGVHVLGSRHVSVAADKQVTQIGGDRTMTVDGDMHVNVRGDWTQTPVPNDLRLQTPGEALRQGGEEKLHVQGNMEWNFHERMFLGTGSIERTWYGGIAKIAGLEGVICGGVWNRLYAGLTINLAAIISIDVYGGSLRAAAARASFGGMGYRSAENTATWRVGLYTRLAWTTIEPLVGSDSQLPVKDSRLKSLAGKLAILLLLPLYIIFSLLTLIPMLIWAASRWAYGKWGPKKPGKKKADGSARAHAHRRRTGDGSEPGSHHQLNAGAKPIRSEPGESMNPQTFGVGQAMANPDVCKTPPLAIPAPFPNIALNATAVPAQYQIMILGQPILTVASVNPMTSGDEAGAMGGVVSQIIKGPCNTVKGSIAYIVGGSPVQRCLDPTAQNGGNSVGAHQAPSQTIVTVLR